MRLRVVLVGAVAYHGWAGGKWNATVREPCEHHRLNNNTIDIW